jgi:small subunit ribosomal protein S4
VVTNLTSNRWQKYPWLEWDQAEMTGKMIHVPERDEIPENIQEQLIVELYSK